jgi:hypothetical protein
MALILLLYPVAPAVIVGTDIAHATVLSLVTGVAHMTQGNVDLSRGAAAPGEHSGSGYRQQGSAPVAESTAQSDPLSHAGLCRYADVDALIERHWKQTMSRYPVTHVRRFALESTISLDSTVVAAQDQVSSEIGDEVAILDLKAGTYYGLDAVGARVWELVQEPQRVREIRRILLEEYEVEPERCGRDLLALLQRLAYEGLVEVRGGTPA